MDDDKLSQVMQSRIIKLVPTIEFDHRNISRDQEAFEIVEQLFRVIAAGELSKLKKFNLYSMESLIYPPSMLSCFLRPLSDWRIVS